MAAPFTLSVMSDLRPGPTATDWRRHYAEFLEEARTADALGYRTIRIPESHGHDDGMMPDPLTVLAAVAPLTRTIRLMTYAIPLALHRPREIVEQAAIVDLLSGGRVELGVGAGGPSDQFEAFGVSMRGRGRIAEDAIPQLRRGFAEGLLDDGHDGRAIPVSPPPVTRTIPIYYGGLTATAVDRAVRLADGTIPYDYIEPDRRLPAFYADLLRPTLERYGRTLDAFFFSVGVVLWVTEDPDRDWHEVIEPALAYRQRKYLEWAGSEDRLEGMTSQASRHGILLGTADDVARRLVEIHRQAPWHDLAFWYRLPGVPHPAAMDHLDRVMTQLVPRLVVAEDARPSP